MRVDTKHGVDSVKGDAIRVIPDYTIADAGWHTN